MERAITNHLVEMTSPFPKGVNVNPPGESGFIKMDGTKSTHYDDQVEMYANWDYKDMLLRFMDVKKNAAEVIKLTY
jgi:penicillin amidase